jgi:ubiquinone/menaquinone biosynthesis C-methylase UbiE
MHENRFTGDIARLRNPERLAWLEADRVAETCLQGKKIHNVLDIGTGSGIFAEAFLKLGLAVEGLDANPDMLSMAREIVPGAKYTEGIAESLPFTDNTFDLVFMGMVLHETDNRIKAVQEAARVCRQRLAVLEWPYEVQDHGPALEVRLSETQLNEIASQAGLEVKKVVSFQRLLLYLLE